MAIAGGLAFRKIHPYHNVSGNSIAIKLLWRRQEIIPPDCAKQGDLGSSSRHIRIISCLRP
jgi:hypothetical protein